MDRRQSRGDIASAAPAVQRLRLVTRRPDSAHAHLARVHPGYRPVRTSRPPGGAFLLESSVVAIGGLLSQRLRVMGTLEGVLGLGDPVRAGSALGLHVASGSVRLTERLPQGGTLACGPGSGGLVRSRDVELSTVGAEFFLIRLPADALQELAGHPRVTATTGPLRVDDAMRAAWAATVRHVHYQAFAADSALALPMLLAQTRRQLAVTIAAAFPGVLDPAVPEPAVPGHATGESADPESVEYAPTYSGRADAGVLPRTVRLAIGFMETHLRASITQEDVAAAADVGLRALQVAFRKHLGTSPHAYLRRLRLERAHEELVRTDLGMSSVAEVAARWGFAHPGRFSRYHRELFGTTPREVVRAG